MVQEKIEPAGGPPGVGWISPTVPGPEACWTQRASGPSAAPLTPRGPRVCPLPCGSLCSPPWTAKPFSPRSSGWGGGCLGGRAYPQYTTPCGGKVGWGRKDPLSSSQEGEPGDLGEGAHSILTPQLCAGHGENGHTRWRQPTLTQTWLSRTETRVSLDLGGQGGRTSGRSP